jgi:hypothetical protein
MEKAKCSLELHTSPILGAKPRRTTSPEGFEIAKVTAQLPAAKECHCEAARPKQSQLVGQAFSGTGFQPVNLGDLQDETVPEFIGAWKLCHAGWPGGHCLRVPKEQEGLFHEEGNPLTALMNRRAENTPLVASRPGRVASGPPSKNDRRPCSTIPVLGGVLRQFQMPVPLARSRSYRGLDWFVVSLLAMTQNGKLPRATEGLHATNLSC